MSDIEKIKELNLDLEIKLSQIEDEMNVEQARKMLVVSECITASIQGYLFKFMTGYVDDKPAKPIPLFFSWRGSA
jgi:hypothetical protein